MSSSSTIDGAEALIVFAHGSSVEEANRAVEDVARQTAEAAGFSRWSAAFLELADPDLSAAVRRLAGEGARRIVIAPYFLVMGVHLQRDFPRLLAACESETPGVELIAADPLGGHPGLIGILAERASKALKT